MQCMSPMVLLFPLRKFCQIFRKFLPVKDGGSLLTYQTRLLCLSHPIPVQLGDLSSPIWSSYYMIYMYVNCNGIYSDELHDSDAKYRYWVYFCVLQFNFDAKATQATMKLCSSLFPSGLPLIRGVRLVHGEQHPWCQGFNKCLNFPL